MNLVKYLVKSDRNLTYFPCCMARHKKKRQKSHRFQYTSKMDSIMWDCDNRSYLELVKYFWVGNYKQCKYQKSVRLRLPVLNLWKFTWEFYYFFVDLSVGGAHLCDSMKLFVALLPFLGLVYCSAAPTDIEKRSAMGLYIMIVFFIFSILCLLNVHYIFLANFLPIKYK